MIVDARFPEKLRFLFRPARYKVAYGGRGSAKSWSFARALLLLAAEKPLRILCARETMKSLADSVHQLLEDQIRELGMQGFYRIEKAAIYGANGSQFSFAGLKHNVAEIKSFEGADIVWVEEAQSVSKHSWNVLIPTIRKEGSEIWISFNPDLESDATYQMFVLSPPPGAIVEKVNFTDNPWFPLVLREEMEHCRATKPGEYDHIWLGNCVNIAEGAIYAEELRKAEAEGRICRVPYDATRPVDTYWDLGFGDYNSIWMIQRFPFEYRVIDSLQGSRHGLAWYLSELQKKPYVWGTDHLPHDARAGQLGTGKSIEELMRAAGRRVVIVAKLSVTDGINAVRTVFGQCWFDKENCADGLQALRHYKWSEIKALNGAPGREPLHDENSHFSDAFRYFAVACKPPKPTQPPQKARNAVVSAWS